MTLLKCVSTSDLCCAGYHCQHILAAEGQRCGKCVTGNVRLRESVNDSGNLKRSKSDHSLSQLVEEMVPASTESPDSPMVLARSRQTSSDSLSALSSGTAQEVVNRPQVQAFVAQAEKVVVVRLPNERRALSMDQSTGNSPLSPPSRSWSCHSPPAVMQPHVSQHEDDSDEDSDEYVQFFHTKDSRRAPRSSSLSCATSLKLGKDIHTSAPSSPCNDRDSAESQLLSEVTTAGEANYMGLNTAVHPPPARARSSYHLTNGQAAVELFLRLNHARQTVDFVKRELDSHAQLNKACMSLPEALETLNELREYETALFGCDDFTPEMPLLEHAYQTAELCRLNFPDKDWMHLAGLLHGVGKLLAHKRFGEQPQWAVCGETYPVGCRFDSAISGSQFFSINPDRRKRMYNSVLGMYSAGCGLHNVYMSWSASEYLYMVLLLNETKLPSEALFLLRYQRFASLTRPNCSYLQLLSPEDEEMLPLLASFQQLATYKKVALPDHALQGEALYRYYDSLIKKYFPVEQLRW